MLTCETIGHTKKAFFLLLYYLDLFAVGKAALAKASTLVATAVSASVSASASTCVWRPRLSTFLTTTSQEDLAVGASFRGGRSTKMEADGLNSTQGPLASEAIEAQGISCGQMTKTELNMWLNVQYYTEGVCFSIVGAVGFVGNIISIGILHTK